MRKPIWAFCLVTMLLTSCGEVSPTENSTVSPDSSSVQNTEGELTIPNVKQYLGYAPTKIDVYFDRIRDDDADLYYEVWDADICRIDDGYVHGLAIGQTTVYASTINGQEVTFEVYIKDPTEYMFNRDVASLEEDYQLFAAAEHPTIFVGDSFFDRRNFWLSFMEDFKSADNCLAFGISSSKTTDWMMARERLISKIQPKNIVMHIGTNDINDETTRSVAEYYEQITRFLATVIRENPTTPIYYFGIENRTQTSGYGAKNPYVEQVTAKIKDEFAPAHPTFHYLDSPAVFNSDQSRYVSGDGIHPSAEGYAYYVRVLREIVDF